MMDAVQNSDEKCAKAEETGIRNLHKIRKLYFFCESSRFVLDKQVLFFEEL